MRAYRLPVRGRIKAIGERASHAMTELLIQQADSRPYERLLEVRLLCRHLPLRQQPSPQLAKFHWSE